MPETRGREKVRVFWPFMTDLEKAKRRLAAFGRVRRRFDFECGVRRRMAGMIVPLSGVNGQPTPANAPAHAALGAAQESVKTLDIRFKTGMNGNGTPTGSLNKRTSIFPMEISAS